jgi:hypothetical protein
MMSPEGKINLTRMYDAGKLSDRRVTEVAGWWLPGLEAVANQRYPDSLMPVADAFAELALLIRFCLTADEVEAAAKAYIEECRGWKLG